MPTKDHTRVSTGGGAPPAEAGKPLQAVLIIESRMGRKVSGEKVNLLFGNQMLIGRDDSCEIQVSDDRTSRKHALIRIDQEAARLSDLGSTNGTTRNNDPVNDEIIIQTGDKICLGRGKTFEARVVERNGAVTSVRLASGADAWLLAPQEFIIGNAEKGGDDVDLKIYDPSILPRHARIEYFAGQTFIVSLDESRLVSVNSGKVREIEIRNDYLIELGDTLIRFERRG